MTRNEAQEGINTTVENTLENVILGPIPSPEQQEKDKQKIRNILVEKNKGEDNEFKEYIKRTEIFYVTFFNGKQIYGVVSFSGKNIWQYIDADGNQVINVSGIRGGVDDEYQKTRYKESLKEEKYTEEKGGNGEYIMHKINKDGSIGKEVDKKKPEYFEAFGKVYSRYLINNINYEIRNNPSNDLKGIVKEGIFWEVLTFQNIEDMKANNQITENEFKQLIPKIAGYYFSLVYTGLISRGKAKEKTQEYFEKGYIDSKTRDDVNYFLDTGNLPK